MKHNRMSLHTLGAKHNAKRKMHIFENRPLLDMQFQISSYIAAFSSSVTDPIDIDATVPKSILQPNAVAIHTNTINGNSVGPGKRRRSKEAPAETRALLIGPIDQPNRNGWPATKILRETTKHFQSGKNAQAAIQPTAVRNRVKVTPKNKRAFGIAPKRCPGVPGSIVVMLYRQSLQLDLKPLARLQPDRTPGKTLGAEIIGSQSAELFEIRNYPK
jgi:hypothetical protein